jgi:N utilization substance protein B
MAICELLFFKDIPPKVSMNEAIELAKLFSTERSGQFINGVLDAVLFDLKTEGPAGFSADAVPKAGRGLYNGEHDEKTERKSGP